MKPIQILIISVLIGVTMSILMQFPFASSESGFSNGFEDRSPNISNMSLVLYDKFEQVSPDSKDLYLEFFDEKNKTLVKNVSFFVNATKDDTVLIHELFFTHTGVMTLKFSPNNDMGKLIINGTAEPTLGGMMADNDILPIEMSAFTPGTYHFHIEALALVDTNHIVDQSNPPTFDSWWSVDDKGNISKDTNSTTVSKIKNASPLQQFKSGVAADNVPLEGSGPPRFQLSQIVASGNNVYVVYNSNIDSQDIFFRKSTDGGVSFDKIIKITNDNGYASDPHVEVSGESVYLTWFASYPDGNTKVFFEKSTDNGNTFANPIVLDPNGGRGYAVIHAMLVTDPNVYMAVNYNNLTSLKVNHGLRTSTDNGATFGKPVAIDDGESLYTKIAVSEHNVYVTWDGESVCPHDKCQIDNIFFSKSVDNGTTFTKPINLSNTTLAFVPQLAASKNNVFVVWSEGQYPNVFFAKSSDGGSTFSDKINLSKKLGYDSEAPQVAVNGNNVFVSFYHYSNAGANMMNSSQGLYLTKSSDGGNTFGEPIKVSSGDNIWASTLDATSGKNAYLSWRTFNITSHRADVFFAKSGDNGTIDNVINLSSSLEENGNLEPELAVDDGNVYVGWDMDVPGDNIYFRASNDDGNTFGNIINLNHEIKIPEFPFAIPILLIGIISIMIFYRIRFER